MYLYIYIHIYTYIQTSIDYRYGKSTICSFFFWKNIGFHIFLYVYPRVPGGKLQEPKPLLIGSTLRLFTLSSGRHPFECIPWLPKPSETSFILWILHSSLKGDHHGFCWPVRATRRLEMPENQLKISEWWNRLAKGFPLTLAQDHYDTEQAHLIFFLAAAHNKFCCCLLILCPWQSPTVLEWFLSNCYGFVFKFRGNHRISWFIMVSHYVSN